MMTAEVLVRCLREEGVRVIFGYPGAAVIPLYEALRDYIENTGELSHLLVRQEQAAGHGASGYSIISGQVGVCLVTSGPGATNLITGIATAYMDNIPMVAITGQVTSNLIGRDVFQEVDITGACESFTKHNYLVRDEKDLPRIIKEAFHLARTGRPGPVLIDIPIDVQARPLEMSYPEEVHMRGYKPPKKASEEQINMAVKAIKKAKRPLLLAGGGVFLSDAQQQLLKLADITGIPVVHTLRGTGCIPTNHPNYIGMIGSHGFPCANKAMEDSDLLFFVGARLADRAMSGVSKEAMISRKLVHIDVDPAEIGKNADCDLPLIGDAALVLQQLIEHAEPLNLDGWAKSLQELRAAENEARSKQMNEWDTQPSKFVNPKYAVQALSDLLDDDAVLVGDVGQNQFWSARNFHIHGRRRFLCSSGLGTMGYSIPAAVGAKTAAPNRTVVSIMGDGSFQMSMQELSTIKANNIGIKMIMFNNSRLGMVREVHQNRYGKHFGIELDGAPDFNALAAAYGIPARRVTDNSGVKSAFKEMLEHDGPFFIECIVDPDESTL